jgi:hypothetical protein
VCARHGTKGEVVPVLKEALRHEDV